MNIYIDFAKGKIEKVTPAPIYFGNNNVDKITLYFKNIADGVEWYPTLSALCSDNNPIYPRLFDTDGTGTKTIDGVDYTYYEFTLSNSNGWNLTPGRTLFYVWVNYPNTNGNKCVGTFGCTILGTSGYYKVDNPVVNPELREYLESSFNEIQNDLDDMTETIEGLGNLEPNGTASSSYILEYTYNHGLLVGTDTGHWYYWDAAQSKYVDGGVYQTAVNYDELEEEIDKLKARGLNIGLTLDYNVIITWTTETPISPTITDFDKYASAFYIIVYTQNGIARYFTKKFYSDTVINFELTLSDGTFILRCYSNDNCTLQYVPNIYLSDISFTNMAQIRSYKEKHTLTTSLTLAQCQDIKKLYVTTDTNIKRLFTRISYNNDIVLYSMPFNDGLAMISISATEKTIIYYNYEPSNEALYSWVDGKMQNVRQNSVAGVLYDNANYSVTTMISVGTARKIIFTSPNTSANNVQNTGAGFFDGNNNFIMGSGVTHRNLASSNSYDLICVDVPTNAKYFRADFRTAQKSEFFIKLLDTYDSIENNQLNYTNKNLITSANTWSGIIPNYDTIMSLYNDLIGEYDDVIIPDDYYDTESASGKFPYKYKVSKKLLGKDASGLYDVFEFTFSPTDYKRSVLFTCVMHGGEEQTTIAMYQLLKHIVDNDSVCQNSPVLSYIRKYVRIYLIPVQNPWGLNNDVYADYNGVNPSRNFPYYWSEYVSLGGLFDNKGTAPFSSQNTKNLLKSYIEHRDEIDFSIDYHTGESSYWQRAPFFYYDNTDDYVRPALKRASVEIINKSSIQDLNPLEQETSRALNIFYINRCLGIPNATIEYSPNLYSNTRNSDEQLTPLMFSYVCYWTELFNLPKRVSKFNSSLSFVRLTRSEYNSLPFRSISTMYIITNENNKKMLGDFEFDTGWIE